MLSNRNCTRSSLSVLVIATIAAGQSRATCPAKVISGTSDAADDVMR
jgi:hypothetical protein